jgi:hypothetical protein
MFLISFVIEIHTLFDSFFKLIFPFYLENPTGAPVAPVGLEDFARGPAI